MSIATNESLRLEGLNKTQWSIYHKELAGNKVDPSQKQQLTKDIQAEAGLIKGFLLNLFNDAWDKKWEKQKGFGFFKSVDKEIEQIRKISKSFDNIKMASVKDLIDLYKQVIDIIQDNQRKPFFKAHYENSRDLIENSRENSKENIRIIGGII